MRPQILRLLLLLLMVTTSCDKIDELTQFELDYTSEYTIPATTLVNTPISINTPEITTDSESEFESNNTQKNLIESIKLKTLTLTLESPEDSNFNFLNDIAIFISAEDVPEIEIASLSDIPEDDRRVLELDTSNAELKEYIKADSYRLRINVTTDGVIDEDQLIEIRTVFDVDAEILGV